MIFPVNLATGEVTGVLPPQNKAHILLTATYGASVTIDAAQSDVFAVTANDANNFTIANPRSSVKGVELMFIVKNDTAGALGTLTWDTQYKLAGAWIQPAAGKRRTITFVSDGTDLVEKSRSAGDI